MNLKRDGRIITITDGDTEIARLTIPGTTTLRQVGDLERTLREFYGIEESKPDLTGAVSFGRKLQGYAEGER